MINITLKGDPLSTNHIYKSHCKFGFPSVYMSQAGKDLKESYQWQAKSQYKGELISGEIYLEVKLFFGTKRKNDIDNFNKIIFDSLSKIVWVDDAQVTKLLIEKCYDKEDPRAELKIKII